MATNLRLRIHSVKCVDETGGKYVERLGNDEIYLGGFLIDAEGEPSKIPQFSVYPHFDDGDIKRYDPPRVFADFNLQAAQTWPKNFSVGFLLFEKDAGDMDEALDKVYQKVKEEIEKMQPSGVHGEFANELSGNDGHTGTIGAITIPWNIIFSSVIPVVVDYVKNKITTAFADEVFPLSHAETTVMSASHTWNGSLASPMTMVEFRGHGGIYQLFYDWELFDLIIS